MVEQEARYRPTSACLAARAARRLEPRLLDDGRVRPGHVADGGEVDRDQPPAEQLQPLGDQGLLDQPAGLLGLLEVAREERHGHPEPAAPAVGPGTGEERLGQRKQHAGAVAGARVGGDRAPVPETLEPAEGGVEDGPAGTAVHIGHEADAAGVALVAPPVVQGPTAAADAWREVVRHLASESNAWGRTPGPGLDTDVQGHENGAAWGERRCSRTLSVRR